MSLNANERKALRALMVTPSVAAAARSCGLSERTLWRYLGQDEFKDKLNERMDKETAALAAAMAGMSGLALEVLQEVLKDKTAAAGVRVKAALGWLSYRRDVMELDALSDRVSELEHNLERKAAR
jgi:uncharacterized protein YjiS (DUF1127 family)